MKWVDRVETHRPARRRRPLALVLCLTCLGGCFSACPSAEDAAARKRIWGPEEPAPEIVAAGEHLDVASLTTDAEVRRRILWMPAAEMAHRLGAFVATNRVKMVWQRGDRKVALDETITLEEARSGDFRVVSKNDAGFGMELRFVQGVVYVRNEPGTFFERRADRAGHLAWRETAMEQLATVLTLARGKVALADLGETSVEGRGARRFALTSAESPVPGAEPPERPSWAHDPVYPKGGPDRALLDRLAVRERGELEKVSGTLIVDNQTGVPLRFDIDLSLRVPAPADAPGPPARLSLSLSRRLSGIGAEHLIERPEHEPFSKRPRAIMDPLAFWPEAKARVAAGSRDETRR